MSRDAHEFLSLLFPVVLFSLLPAFFQRLVVREVKLTTGSFGSNAPDLDGRSARDRAMAETIAKTDLPADPKELRAALNAMLKPLVDRMHPRSSRLFANTPVRRRHWFCPIRSIRP
jgi:hypothetical protein